MLTLLKIYYNIWIRIKLDSFKMIYLERRKKKQGYSLNLTWLIFPLGLIKIYVRCIATGRILFPRIFPGDFSDKKYCNARVLAFM